MPVSVQAICTSMLASFPSPSSTLKGSHSSARRATPGEQQRTPASVPRPCRGRTPPSLSLSGGRLRTTITEHEFLRPPLFSPPANSCIGRQCARNTPLPRRKHPRVRTGPSPDGLWGTSIVLGRRCTRAKRGGNGMGDLKMDYWPRQRLPPGGRRQAEGLTAT
jgi:hypothetical protein